MKWSKPDFEVTVHIAIALHTLFHKPAEPGRLKETKGGREGEREREVWRDMDRVRERLTQPQSRHVNQAQVKRR